MRSVTLVELIEGLDPARRLRLASDLTPGAELIEVVNDYSRVVLTRDNRGRLKELLAAD